MISTRWVRFTWSSVLLEERNGIITGYVINVTAVERGEKLQLQSQYNNITISAYPYTTYEFIIAATTVAGRGPFSTVVTARTPPDGTFQSAQQTLQSNVEICNTNLLSSHCSKQNIFERFANSNCNKSRMQRTGSKVIL